MWPAVPEPMALQTQPALFRQPAVRICDRTVCPDQPAIRSLYKTPWWASIEIEISKSESNVRESYLRRMQTSIEFGGGLAKCRGGTRKVERAGRIPALRKTFQNFTSYFVDADFVEEDFA
jgi:hypothetical protein